MFLLNLFPKYLMNMKICWYCVMKDQLNMSLNACILHVMKNLMYLSLNACTYSCFMKDQLNLSLNACISFCVMKNLIYLSRNKSLNLNLNLNPQDWENSIIVFYIYLQYFLGRERTSLDILELFQSAPPFLYFVSCNRYICFHY